MIPFFLSAPRTRSSVLFELAEPYLLQKHDLHPINGHTEYFLTRAYWAQMHDARTDTVNKTQMMPHYNNGKIVVHHVYPPIYPDISVANHNKLIQLKKARDDGYEFNLKGTIECADSAEEILDFYKDRKIIITKRRNLEELVASTLFAVTVKTFHLRESNKEKYQSLLKTPITLSPQQLAISKDLLEYVFRLWDMERLAKQNNIATHVTYYEDLDSESAIFNELDNIFETCRWRDSLPENYTLTLPQKIEKDYSKLINNYDEIKEIVRNVSKF